MGERPEVQDSVSQFAWGIPALVVGVLLLVFGANSGAPILGLVGLVVVLLGVIWTATGIVRSARNRDAVARALLEERQRGE